jgi:hypothetical protein
MNKKISSWLQKIKCYGKKSVQVGKSFFKQIINWITIRIKDGGEALHHLSMSTKPLLFSLKIILTVFIFGVTFWAYSTPQVENKPLELTQYTQHGEWTYRANLIPNSVYTEKILETEDVYFARLIENLMLEYQYQFNTPETIENSQFLCQTEVVFGTEELWEKQILSKNEVFKGTDHFTVHISIPIANVIELYDSVRNETQSNLGMPNIQIHINIIPQVETQYGTITESFSHPINFSYNQERLEFISERQKSDRGSITGSVKTIHYHIWNARLISGLLSLVGLYFVGHPISLQIQDWRAIPQWKKELRKAKRKLKGLLIKVDSIPDPTRKQRKVKISAVTDMIDLSLETGYPVLYYTNPNIYIIYIINTPGTYYSYCPKDIDLYHSKPPFIRQEAENVYFE